MTCEEFKGHNKNTLRGFVTLRLPSGLRIFGVTLHEQNGKRWVSLPARPYKDEAGTEKWSPVIDIPDFTTRDRFRIAALEAINAYRAAHPETPEKVTETGREEADDVGF